MEEYSYPNNSDATWFPECVIPLSDNLRIAVSVQEYFGKIGLDIRHQELKGGEWRYTRKKGGVRLYSDDLAALKPALEFYERLSEKCRTKCIRVSVKRKAA